MPDSLGLYLHIPFCQKKCGYCDFYSAFAGEDLMNRYVAALIEQIHQWGGSVNRPIRTIYFGGGTPSLLGKRIESLMQAIAQSFEVLPGCEVTAEINPTANPREFLQAANSAGVNRLSVGVQSANPSELKVLGRTHTIGQAARTIALARAIGFKNLSLDLMLGLPGSNFETLKRSIDFVLQQNPQHISAYLLQIEPHTRFAMQQDLLKLPDEDEQAQQNLFLCDRLKQAGFLHYEISNFCKPHFESRHNCIYWHDEEYLGLGPSAHSFLKGKRFYYPPDLKEFLSAPHPLPESEGGDPGEKIMLGLRLLEGVDFSNFPTVQPLLNQLISAGLGYFSENRFVLSDRGMLVSNSIITEILECLP